MRRRDVYVPPEAIKAFCQKNQVRELAVFCSALRDDFGSDSDLDVLIDFKPGARVGFIRLSQLQRELSAILHRPVDLVPKAGLKAVIRDDILSSAEVLYAA
jgi:predicted nucleotidyltransferase